MSSGHATGHGEHAEGPVAKSIEQQTAKLPSDLFVGSVRLYCRVARI